MKFGRFKMGTEKFGSYTGASSATTDGFALGGGNFFKYDTLFVPRANQYLSLTDGYVETTASKAEVIDSVVAAGGILYKGIG